MANHTGSIREAIEALEKIKDRIIEFWNSQVSMDEAQRIMWIGDVQEMYYLLVSAWVFSREDINQEDVHPEAVQFALQVARSRLEQVASELRAYPDYATAQLEQEMRQTFEECWKPLAVQTGFRELLHQLTTEPPSTPVVKVGPEEYHLLCATCGEVAFVFRIGIPRHVRERRLIYRGLTHRSDMELEHAEHIFALLEKERIGEVHRYFQQNGRPEGMDAYCPECDRIYCRGHYHLEEAWDEGFYDCTYGTCPEGHRRMVDD